MRRRTALVVAAGLTLSVPAYRVLVHQGHLRIDAAAHIAVAWTYLVAGLIGWSRRPQSRVGPLLVAAGFALLVRRFQYSDDSALFTAAFALGELSTAFIAHAILGYPTGRLQSASERVLITLGYVLVVAFPLATLAVYDPSQSCLFYCDSQHPPRSLLLLYGNHDLFQLTRYGFRVVVFGALGLAFLVLVGRKLLRASRPRRRMLAPVLVAGLAAAVRVVSEAALAFEAHSEATRRMLFWWQIAAQAVIPLALLVGLLQARLARLSVADLLLELQRSPPSAIPAALRRTLGDPSLDVAYWVPELESYVDMAGQPSALPDQDPNRAVTLLSRGEEPIAALIHDPALEEVPVVLGAAGAAAGLALENARLEAELRAQLAAVRESRARIVTAGDTERRRIEQDLHDGAQQRLVALALGLRAAQHRFGDQLFPEIRHLFDRSVDEIQTAIEELRELAHGLHPALLTQGGLAAALPDLADRSPIPVEVLSAPPERLAEDIEATVYFVACEALANVAKHAGASHATLSARREDGGLVVEVADDGVGGAAIGDGSGLRGLVDRVEAKGGSLHVISPLGEGTRVVGRIPCGS
jgi:signal transduction histidine kinase